MIYNAFVMSNFNYCPIVWHFCSVKSQRKIEKIQERALRFMLNDDKSNYQELLGKAKIDTMHLKRLKCIATEIYIRHFTK